MVVGLIALLAASTMALQDAPPASIPSCAANVPGFKQPDNVVRPKYPKDLLKAGVQGLVEIRAVISPGGKTQELTLVSGPPAFTTPSLDAVRKWRFYPAQIDNAPVETTYRVRVKFNLLLQEAVPEVTLVSPLPVEPALPETSQVVRNTSEGPVYRVSKQVMLPKVIYQVDPEFSEAARKAREQGHVRILLIVGADGLPHDLRLSCTDSPDLSENALNAVKQWRFQPGIKEGQPVQVEITVEVEFHLNSPAADAQ